MPDGKGDTVDVPPHMIETLRSNAVILLDPATVLDFSLDSLRFPLTDIARMQTYEYDIIRTAIAVGIGLATAISGVLLLFIFEAGIFPVDP
ncbi:MAG: hypothetical protein KFH87_00840 [Bacteroidetes bacterium]|nr:hypothetical protein [Bacteroidota bacterium]